MTFSNWLFGGIENPFEANQWGALHIATLVCCAALILAFTFLAKSERSKKYVVYTLAGAIVFFEIMIRFVYAMKLYYFHQPEMNGLTWYWILLPKPWCAVSCWALIAAVFIKKKWFYNFSSLSALLCSIVFFIYPGVGYNNVHLLFENWYSILTHALLLTTSITLITLGYTDFQYREFWKVAVSFILVILYAFVEIFVLKIQEDPMYFMPGGDIQADILHLPYGLYVVAYVAILAIFINVPYLLTLKGKKAAQPRPS